MATTTHLPALGRHRREEVGHELQQTLVELIDLSLVGKQLLTELSRRLADDPRAASCDRGH